MAWKVGIDEHGQMQIEANGFDVLGIDRELTQVCHYRMEAHTYAWFEAKPMDEQLLKGKIVGGKQSGGSVNDDYCSHPYYGQRSGKMGYLRETPIAPGTRVIARNVCLTSMTKGGPMEHRVDTQYWDYCVDRETLLNCSKEEPHIRRFIPDLRFSPVDSYLCNPYQNSYLRNREQCRSLHWRTRLCLQPEGIV